MSNLAPVFGAPLGYAYITNTTNYLHLVAFHSVVILIPMFLVWSWMLARYDFRPLDVFLLFGLTGCFIESGQPGGRIYNTIWLFVYGLMVYIPALAVPERNGLRTPRIWHYALAVFLPVTGVVLAAPFGVLHHLLGLRQIDFDVLHPIPPGWPLHSRWGVERPSSRRNRALLLLRVFLGDGLE